MMRSIHTLLARFVWALVRSFKFVIRLIFQVANLAAPQPVP